MVEIESNPQTLIGEEPSKTDDTSSNELAPLLAQSAVKTVSFVRRRWLLLLFVVVAVTVIDVALFYKNMKTPKIHKVELSFEPTVSGAQAQMRVQGEASKSSHTASFSVSSVHCEYSYRADSLSSYRPGGRVEVAFPAAGNTADDAFDLDVQLKDTSFDVLRRVYWDVSSAAEAQSWIKLQCSVALHAKLYGALPLSYDLQFADQWDLSSLKHRAAKSLTGQDSKKSFSSALSVQNKKLTMNEVVYALLVDLSGARRIEIGGSPVDSFVVNLPALAYSTVLVDKESEKKSYLVLRSSAATFDVAAQSTAPVEIDVSLRCTAAALSLGDALASDASCSLLGPLNVGEFKAELVDNKFVSVAAQSLEKNFLSLFLGESHYIRTVSEEEAKRKAPAFQSGADAMNAKEKKEKEKDSRALANYDPTISTGASCVTVDSDGVYMSSACSVVEPGFFKLYLGVYSDEGFAGYVNSETSWAPSLADVAFSSSLDSQFISAGTPYALNGSMFFSENTQNLTATALFSQYETVEFLETLTAAWSFADEYSTGAVEASSLTVFDGYEPIKALATLDYGSDAYNAAFLVSDSSAQEAGDALAASANGGYGGDWTNWFFTVEQSTLTYERSVVGFANAKLATQVASNGAFGAIQFQGNGQDSAQEQVFLTRGDYGWSTPSNWAEAGSMTATSFGFVNDTECNWNVSSLFSFQDGNFTGYFTERDFFNADSPANVDITARGTYSVVNSLQWGVSLKNSQLLMSGAYEGQAIGAINFNMKTPSSNGLIDYSLSVTDSNDVAVLLSTKYLEYNSVDWVSSGTATVRATLYFPAWSSAVNWQFRMMMMYQDGSYQVMMAEQTVEGYENVNMAALGTYGGDFYNWWLELSQSSLSIDNSLLGYARGKIMLQSNSGLSNANFTSISNILDAADELVFEASHDAQWSTPSSWEESGDVTYTSSYNHMDNYMMGFGATLNYADDKFAFTLRESDCSGVQANCTQNSMVVAGNGVYSGTLSEWQATLAEANFLVNDELQGIVKAHVVGNTPGDWVQGTVNYKTKFLDSAAVQVMRSVGSTAWNSPSSWLSEGNILMNSFVDANGSAVNSSLSFSYDSETYTGAIEANDVSTGVAVNKFTATARGMYMFSSISNWLLTIADSLIADASTVYVNTRLYLQMHKELSDASDLFLVIANMADYAPSSDVPAMYTDKFPEENTDLWTQNLLYMSVAYDEDSEVSETIGYLSTNTTYQAEPQFFMLTETVVNMPNETAYFLLQESLLGVEGVNSWGYAQYDMATGMIAQMAGEVAYEGIVYGGMNTDFDMQMKAAYAPGMPTFAPTTAPTIAPTTAPTTAPTVFTSFAPTAAPTVFTSLAPTAAPTVVPSKTPTQAPTTAAPTRSPTLFPTGAPATVTFAVVQTLNGISLSTYNSNLEANNNALRASIAMCMTGVTSDNVQFLVVMGLPSRSRRLGERETHAVLSDTSSVYASYSINVVSALSYDELSNQLDTSVANQQFDAYLATESVAYGATNLTTVTSSAVSTYYVPPSTYSSSSSGVSAGVIAGAVVGSVVGVALLAGLVFFCLYKKQQGLATKADDVVFIEDNPIGDKPKKSVEIDL